MYRHILVPVDGSTTSSRGLDEAIKLAKLTGGRIRLVHAVDEMFYAGGAQGFVAYPNDLVSKIMNGGKAILERGRAVVVAASVVVETELIEAFGERAADLVIDAAQSWPADLIVLGTHGRRGVRRLLLGSDAEQIARASSVPVLLVRTPATDVDASEQTEPSGAVAAA